ncbi:MAG: hypothetical protein SGCHY_000062 [Lobulomycetales sp.]
MANEQQMRMRNALAAKNVTKRGNVKKTLQDEKKKGNLQFWVLAFIVFVVVGSTVFEIFSKLFLKD